MEHTSLDIEYLYDFIYLDHSRIASYVAQLDINGVLTSIKSNAALSNGMNGNGKFGAFISAGFSGTRTSSESIEKSFDPRLVLPAVSNLLRLVADEFGDMEEGAGVPVGTLDNLRRRIDAAL